MAHALDQLFDALAGNRPSERYDLGGTWRASTIEATLERLPALMRHVGITRVADVTGLDCLGIPTAMAIRPTGRSLSCSQGKGLTPALAFASAAFEGIELHYAERPPAPVMTASFHEIGGRQEVIDPRRLGRGFRNDAYQADRSMEWVEGYDLLSGGRRLVPRVVCDLDTATFHPDRDLFVNSSSGLGGGNDLVEAVCHALYELIERDCTHDWKSMPPEDMTARQVKLSSIHTPHAGTLIRQVLAAKVVPFVYDITNRMNVPAFVCIFFDAEDSWRQLPRFMGSGCHMSSEVAICRAITEAAQSRLTHISGSRDDKFPGLYENLRSKHSWSPPGDPENGIDLVVRAPSGTTLDQDLRHLLDQLRRRQCRDLVMIEHTEPGMGGAVVRLLAPELNHLGLTDMEPM